jgi:hypothetical protein
MYPLIRFEPYDSSLAYLTRSNRVHHVSFPGAVPEHLISLFRPLLRNMIRSAITNKSKDGLRKFL